MDLTPLLVSVLPPRPPAALSRGSPALAHTERDGQESGITEDEHPQLCHPLSSRPDQQLQIAIPVYDSNQESQDGSDHVLDSLPQGVPLGAERDQETQREGEQ